MIMRYISRHILAFAPVTLAAGAAALLALAACSREQVVDADEPFDDGVQHAYIVAPTETRTDFDSYVGKFAWSEGDEIAIHLSDGTFYSTEVNAETGAFACSTTPSKKRDAYAVYPAAAADAANYGSPTLNVVLPAEYDISANLFSDYSPVPMIAVNKQAEDDLYFRHVGGLLRITCDRVPVGTQKIAVTASRNIAGTFSVTNPASDNPTISTGGNAQTVTFRVAETYLSQRTDGIILNLPVPIGPVTTLKVAALNNTGTEIYSDTRDIDIDIARYSGKKCAYSLTRVIHDSMQLVVRAGDDTAWEFEIPFPFNLTLPGDMRILWGDGSYSEAPAGSTKAMNPEKFKHTYAAPGDYTITIETVTSNPDGPQMPEMVFMYRNETTYENSRLMLKAVPTPLLRMDIGGGMLFAGCRNLESICPDLLSKNRQFTTLASAFSSCTSLTGSIPDGFFDNNPYLQSFNGIFQNCTGLTGSIPPGLFDKCTRAKDFSDMFSRCTGLTGRIPEGLFDHCPDVTTFERTFSECSGLTGSIPDGLFAHNSQVTIFNGVFNGCTGLTGCIPDGLFDGCPSVLLLGSAFSGCSGLTGRIPEGLFGQCTLLRDVGGCFSGCTGLTGEIPAGLFAACPDVRTFGSVFSGCTGLTGGIPANLFAGKAQAYGFSWAFFGCSGLTGSIPEGLFAGTKGSEFASVFEGCTGLSGSIPGGLFSGVATYASFKRSFAGCTGLSGLLPAGLFAGKTGTTSFEETFMGCSGLTGAIPADLFDGCAAVTSFRGVFNGCSGLTTLPGGLFASCDKVKTYEYAFNGCSSLGGIPSGLFDNSPKVTTFAYLFADCTGLRGAIPDHLFDNCPEVTVFSRVFLNCSGLSGNMPSGLFSKNMKAWEFYLSFMNCTHLNIVPDVFTGTTSTPATRFADIAPGLIDCFSYIGGGTAPELWNYTYRYLDYRSYERCFRGSTGISNYSAIPTTWK